MNKSMILQIFRGERGQYETVPMKQQEYRHQAEEAYNTLKDRLSKEDFELFNDFVDKNGFAHCEEMDNHFLEGFKVGLRVGIECMDDERLLR